MGEAEAFLVGEAEALGVGLGVGVITVTLGSEQPKGTVGRVTCGVGDKETPGDGVGVA